ncbi:MAG: NAD-dependent epimerase/dehydratase family protein [Oligoflexia bacterium]|nr:NAD-dependent epimerase/dehydratase family protein [Oligoflexia bacterium]
MANEKILLTGIAGFVGFHTALSLIEKGYSIVGVDNINDFYDTRLKDHRLEQLAGIEGIEFHKIDIEDRDALEELFKKNSFSRVINLAARAGVPYSIKNPEIYMSTNAQGSLNLLNLCRDYDVKKYVLASTSSLYAGHEMPFIESSPVNRPISPYASSKKAAEVMAYTYHYLYGIDVSVVRYFTVFGPAGRPDMSIFRFIRWIEEGGKIELFGDGSQSRDFTYVKDIAEGTIKAAFTDVGYEVINLGGGKRPITIMSVINMIEEKLGKKANIENKEFLKTDLKSSWANIEKAKELLDWEPETSFEAGLDQTIEWFEKNKELCLSINL